jgi:hypothetical protein
VKVQYLPHVVDRDGELRDAAVYVEIGVKSGARYCWASTTSSHIESNLQTANPTLREYAIIESPPAAITT